MDLGLKLRKLISKQESTSSRYYLCMCVCARFQAKQAALTFPAQICTKVDLGLAIQKTIVGIRINILDMPYVSFFSQNKKLWICRPKFVPKNDFGLGTEKSNVQIRINIVETLSVLILCQTGQLWVSRSNFAQKWI